MNAHTVYIRPSTSRVFLWESIQAAWIKVLLLEPSTVGENRKFRRLYESAFSMDSNIDANTVYNQPAVFRRTISAGWLHVKHILAELYTLVAVRALSVLHNADHGLNSIYHINSTGISKALELTGCSKGPISVTWPKHHQQACAGAALKCRRGYFFRVFVGRCFQHTKGLQTRLKTNPRCSDLARAVMCSSGTNHFLRRCA